MLHVIKVQWYFIDEKMGVSTGTHTKWMMELALELSSNAHDHSPWPYFLKQIVVIAQRNSKIFPKTSHSVALVGVSWI